jgi:hypothetical protein
LTRRRETVILSHVDRNSDAGDPLDEIRAARRRLAERLYTPWWYHPVLGLLLGILVLQIGGVFGWAGVLVTPVPVLGVFALGRIYRRLSGIDLYGTDAPDGDRRGRAVLAAYIYSLIMCFTATFLLSHHIGVAWAPWVFAVLVATGTVVLGRIYDGLLRAQLGHAAR